MTKLTIAIDGPAASGKGTLARKLAAHFDLPHLDTGLTYRAVGNALLQVGLPLDDEALAVKVAENLNLGKLDREILSNHEVGEAASKIAVMSRVREILVEMQRKFATSGKGAVLDGRDIGTVVCPDAEVKLYITASPRTRAQRRFNEANEKGSGADYEQILKDIIMRDDRDANREDSPMVRAENAHLIDTSEMSIETAFETALELVEEAISGK